MTFCFALTMREGCMSSASMDKDRSKTITNASFFCSQVGPARPMMLIVSAKSITALSHVPEVLPLSSMSTESSSLFIALSHLERPRVCFIQKCTRAAKGRNANKHSGRRN